MRLQIGDYIELQDYTPAAIGRLVEKISDKKGRFEVYLHPENLPGGRRVYHAPAEIISTTRIIEADLDLPATLFLIDSIEVFRKRESFPKYAAFCRDRYDPDSDTYIPWKGAIRRAPFSAEASPTKPFDFNAVSLRSSAASEDDVNENKRTHDAVDISSSDADTRLRTPPRKRVRSKKVPAKGQPAKGQKRTAVRHRSRSSGSASDSTVSSSIASVAADSSSASEAENNGDDGESSASDDEMSSGETKARKTRSATQQQKAKRKRIKKNETQQQQQKGKGQRTGALKRLRRRKSPSPAASGSASSDSDSSASAVAQPSDNEQQSSPESASNSDNAGANTNDDDNDNGDDDEPSSKLSSTQRSGVRHTPLKRLRRQSDEPSSANSKKRSAAVRTSVTPSRSQPTRGSAQKEATQQRADSLFEQIRNKRVHRELMQPPSPSPVRRRSRSSDSSGAVSISSSSSSEEEQPIQSFIASDNEEIVVSDDEARSSGSSSDDDAKALRPPLRSHSPENLTLEMVLGKSNQADAFAVYCRYLAHCALDQAFLRSRDHPRDMMMSSRRIESLVLSKRDSLASSQAWRAEVRHDLDRFPLYEDSEAHTELEDCEACGRRNHTATHRVFLSGPSYDPQKFWGVPTTIMPDVNRVSSDERRYLVGPRCHRRTQLYHTLQHYKYHLVASIRDKADWRSSQNEQQAIQDVVADREWIRDQWGELQQLLDDADRFALDVRDM